MRKSEMIQRISQLLIEVSKSKTAEALPLQDVCLHAAGFILEEMENMGMQPPIQSHQHGSIQWTDLEWESEDAKVD